MANIILNRSFSILQDLNCSLSWKSDTCLFVSENKESDDDRRTHIRKRLTV